MQFGSKISREHLMLTTLPAMFNRSTNKYADKKKSVVSARLQQTP